MCVFCKLSESIVLILKNSRGWGAGQRPWWNLVRPGLTNGHKPYEPYETLVRTPTPEVNPWPHTYSCPSFPSHRLIIIIIQKNKIIFHELVFTIINNTTWGVFPTCHLVHWYFAGPPLFIHLHLGLTST